MKSSPAEVRNILLIRTDRIGDVVLSLPMLPVLKKHFPKASITMMVRKYTRELVERHSCVSDIVQWDDDGERTLSEYVKIVKQRSFDIAIVPYPRFILALIIYLAGIPVRVGTGYRWYSFLFNHKVYEHRKDAKRHEVEYNLNLLKAIGIENTGTADFELDISADVQQKIDEMLSKDSMNTFVVLHVGSGGSARDWSLQNFAALGDRIRNDLQCNVILTGGESEKSLVASVVSNMKTSPVNYTGLFSLVELGALFKRASAFVSNSTGPLHIAAAVGTPVIGFYPPILQCSAVRWGPYTNKKKVFTADSARCPLCKGGACQSNVCMDQITVDQVFHAVQEHVNEHR
ncbi:MAG: glycosyltransferase family 9 protein [Bacteroidota bacterium]